MIKVYYNSTTKEVIECVENEKTAPLSYPFIMVDVFNPTQILCTSIKVVNGNLVYEEYKPKPTTLTPRQARLALLQVGLLDELETAIANDRALGIWWEYSLDIRRDNPELLAFASAYGLTDTQLDDLFELGASL